MTTKTLLMFAATGLLPVAFGGSAIADISTMTLLPGPIADTAPVSNGRLRRTNEEQAGREMPAIMCRASGKCLAFMMSTELPPLTAGGTPRRANDRVQLSKTSFQLSLDANGVVV